MSLQRFLRSDFPAANITSSTPIALLAHGGASLAWSIKNPVTRLAFRYTPIVYSLQLPYHGRDEPNLAIRGEFRGTDREMLSAIENVGQMLVPVVSQRYVIFLGYSLGQFLNSHSSNLCNRFVLNEVRL